MHTFFLNLASHSGILACVTDDRVVSSFAVDHRIDDAALVPHVEAVIKEAGWSYADLTQIACAVGPGGFTSLRVAVALSNALSSQLGIPVCGIHLSDLYESRITNLESRIAFWCHSTKKQELFIRGFGDVTKEFPEPQCVTLDDLQKVIKKGSGWMGELIPEHRKIVDDAGVQEVSLRPAEDVLPSFLKIQKYKSQILQPWYGRGW